MAYHFSQCNGNIKENFITGNFKYIDEELSKNTLYKSLVKENQVLITIAGTIGNALVAQGLPINTNSNQAIANITLKKDVNPFYVSTFLNSVFGKYQSQRLIVSNVQPNLLLVQVKSIKIPIFSQAFQLQIEKMVKGAQAKQNQSKELYAEAEKILLAELGLINWKAKHRLWFVKNYSDTQEAERIDAEYFQPKYDEITNAIKNYSGGWDTLANIVSIKKCVEVGSNQYLNEGIPFVRVSNLSLFEITEEKYISEKLYFKIKDNQPQKGEILFSKDATPGIAYYLNEIPQKMILSSGILRLNNKTEKITNECLTLTLNSILIQKQVKRDVGGSIIMHWRPEQVKKVIIPIFSKEIQTKIQQKIEESFRLRQQSKHLLDCAKKTVDIAIEKDEQLRLSG